MKPKCNATQPISSADVSRYCSQNPFQMALELGLQEAWKTKKR